jgi:zona occludens toxin
MINFMGGLPGGGKTYEAVVNHIIPALTRDKRKVITNLPMNKDLIRSLYPEIDIENLLELVEGEFHNFGGERPFSKVEHYLQYEEWSNNKNQKAYFFIDEAHLSIPTGTCDQKLKEFFTVHRHYGFDIMFISALGSDIDRNVRNLIDNMFIATKLGALGMDKKYALRTYVKFSIRPPRNSMISERIRKYEPEYFPYYQSHTKSNSAVSEATMGDVKKFFHYKFFWVMCFSFLLSFFAVIFLISTHVLSGEDEINDNPFNNKSVTMSQSLSGGQLNSVTMSQKSQSSKPQNNLVGMGSNRRTESKYHPYDKLKLHVSGWSEFKEYGRNVKEYYFDVTKNGRYLFQLKLTDLRLAGYEVYIKGNCLVQLVFDSYSDFITCDIPAVNEPSPLDAIDVNLSE